MRKFTSKLAPIIKEYLEYRKTLGYSLSGDEGFLSRFDNYCAEHHPDLKSLTKESVRGWINYEISHGRTGTDKKVVPLRKLAKYMGNGAYILPPKVAPKPPRCIPYILSDDELFRLFTAADNIKAGYPCYRIKSSLKNIFPTLLRLMYTCGLRPHEVRLIKRDNINFDTGEILIEKTKGHGGHKERIIVMSDDMLEQCRKYDTVREITNPQSEYFFVREDGAIVSRWQLANNIWLCWQRANPDVPTNVLPRIRPYDIRHRFASAVLQKWLNEGQDLYTMLPYLRAYMGHECFSSTAYYIHLLPENLLASSGVDWEGIDSVDPEVDIWEN